MGGAQALSGTLFLSLLVSLASLLIFWGKSWSCLSLPTFSSDCVVHAPLSLEPGLPWLCAQLGGTREEGREAGADLRGNESAEAIVCVLPAA